MESVHLIEEMQQLRAISDPLRVDIVRSLVEEPRTAAGVAAAVGRSASKLYYHISELERVGLIELVETRQRGNLIEKWYRAVAASFILDRGILNRAPEGGEAFYWKAADALDAANRGLESAVREREYETSETLAEHRSLRLNPERAAEFRRRLEDLVEEFDSSKGSGVASDLTVVFYSSSG